MTKLNRKTETIVTSIFELVLGISLQFPWLWNQSQILLHISLTENNMWVFLLQTAWQYIISVVKYRKLQERYLSTMNLRKNLNNNMYYYRRISR